MTLFSFEKESKMKPPVELTVALTPASALALAHFVKHISHDAIRQCSRDDAETFLVRDALDTLREALVLAGCAPH